MQNIDRRTFLALAGTGIASFALAACSGTSGTGPSTSGTGSGSTASSSSEESSAQASADSSASSAASGSASSIVVYFSATGTTKGIAERLQALAGSDIYEIVPAESYTSDDLNYSDSKSRTTIEQNDPDVRPALAEEPPDLSVYGTVYLGYPIWWGEAPRIMDTFVESADFSHATIVPFCTSSSSSIGSSAKTLESEAKGGTWKQGGRIDASASDSDLQKFIEDNR